MKENSCVDVTEQEAAELLLGCEDVLILCHVKPDGDTLGSGFAMLHALRALGKRVRIACAEGFPKRYEPLYQGVDLEGQPEFAPRFVLAVDVADTKLLGKNEAPWGGRVDLCIDHHPSNRRYGRHLLLDGHAAATAEIIARTIRRMNAPLTQETARCIYTGLATDTGCFRFSNTTANTLRLAAEMMDTGFDSYSINKRMFETKSAARVAVEERVIKTLEYFCGGRVAVMVISRSAVEETGALDEELDGLSGIPREIEGVEVGITLKERPTENGGILYRVSMRGDRTCNVSEVCARFGGGGHPRAAGCTLEGNLDEVKARLLEAVSETLGAAL